MSEDYVPDVPEVVKVARDLTEIERLAAELEEEALDSSNDRLMPGGKAAVALAPVANLEAWANRLGTAERMNLDTSYVLDEDDAWEPPLQTLCFWSEEWRREHEAEYGQRATLSSEAGFLRWCLNWAYENEVHWDDFAKDIRKARVRLEDIVHDGVRAERSRVPCTNELCERKPRLIKVYGLRAIEDGYKCPACKHRYDQSAYARAMYQHLDSQGADRHVKAQDAFQAISRSDRTWRKWLRFWYVRSYVDPLTSQRWVWWPDVREVDLATQKRGMKRPA